MRNRLPGHRQALVIALGLALSAAAHGSGAQTAPRIGKPQPAPDARPVMPLPPAVIDNKLNIAGDEVKARKVDTRLTVEVRVNGRGPYHFLVDSGADTSVVGLRIAEELQLPLGAQAILHSMTDRNVVDRVKVDELAVGPSKVRGLVVPALREQDLGAAGVIGIDALANQRLMLDFDKRLIKVEDARVRYRPLPGEIVVTAKRKRGQLILTRVRAGGQELDAVIDTGSEITIGNSALRDKLLSRGRAKFWKVAATGVTGKAVELEIALVQELRFGSVTLANVPIAFADVPPFELFGLADQPALLLGTDLLDTFRRVSLDFRSRKVRFQLRRCTSHAVTISTAPMPWATRLSASDDAEVCR